MDVDDRLTSADIQSDLPDVTNLSLKEIADSDTVLSHALRRIVRESTETGDVVAGHSNAVQ
jgi:FXSXX-COOH protein